MCIGTSAVLPEIPRGISQMRASCTKQDLVAIEQDLLDEIAGLDHKIEIPGRDLTIRMGGIAILLFGALASIKFFG
jgi:hypothetical protein